MKLCSSLALASVALALSVTVSAQAQAASCCGAGSAAPSIITGDDFAQLSASISQSQVIGDAPASGQAVFRADGDSERALTVRLEGALLLSDRWQLGASLPLVRRSRETQRLASSATGIGDLNFTGTFEALPEWGYSDWRPRGFVFVQATLPTGGSSYELSLTPSSPWDLEARGQGFYNLGGGALLIKSWGNWDALTLAEIHRSLPRSFNTQDGALKVTPGWGGSATLGGGYSPSSLPLRFGLTLSPAYEGGTQSEGIVVSASQSKLVWNTSAQIAWMVTQQSSLSATYTDQTLVGPASNTTLSRSLALLLQKRWER